MPNGRAFTLAADYDPGRHMPTPTPYGLRRRSNGLTPKRHYLPSRCRHFSRTPLKRIGFRRALIFSMLLSRRHYMLLRAARISMMPARAPISLLSPSIRLPCRARHLDRSTIFLRLMDANADAPLSL